MAQMRKAGATPAGNSPVGSITSKRCHSPSPGTRTSICLKSYDALAKKFVRSSASPDSVRAQNVPRYCAFG